MNRWFGEPWPRENFRAEMCEDDSLRIPVPVGETCYLCGTPIIETDRGQESYGIGGKGQVVGPMYHHIECQTRAVVGPYELLVSGERHGDPGHVCPTTEDYRADALKVWAWVETHPFR